VGLFWVCSVKGCPSEGLIGFVLGLFGFVFLVKSLISGHMLALFRQFPLVFPEADLLATRSPVRLSCPYRKSL
jgi:hypothetical protein